LDDGISHVTLMNSALLPVCERLIFKSPDKGPDLALTTDKSNYASREKVTIHIEAEQLKTGTVPSNLSMSVYKNDEKDNGSIVSNFLLTSDLKGYVENPDYYFDPNHESELDVLLLTHGWRRFLWDDIISGKEPVISYPPEIHSPILTGKVINTNSEAKLESVFWGFPGKFPTLNSAQLNSDGTFYFEVPFRIKNERVIFWSRDDTLKSDEIQLESSFILSSEAGKKGNSIEPKLREYIEHSNANIQINSVYRKQTQISGLTGTVPEATTPFYGMPDVHYKLDDYTRFVEMNEIFIEYIRSVVIKRRESKSYFYVAQRGRNGQKAFDLPTLVLFDGVPINDADFMLELDPLKVEEIDVVNEYYQIGVHQFDGILNFITYHGDLAGTPLPSNFIEKVYHALQTPREFYSPEYETADQKAGRTPDFRSVLLWEPNIDLGPSGTITIEFYTSDDNGSYKIDLQGVSESGIPLHAELEFKVNIDS